jgi:hypothetical protein
LQYCFEDPAARTHFEDDIKAGWKLWTDAIGQASDENGHSLVFREFAFKKDIWVYCYNERKQPNDPWVWNPAVPHDITVIATSKDTNVQASSVTGYNPQGWSDEAGRNGTHLGLAFKEKYPADYWHTTVAHELTHIFGFWHEHHCKDRNSYVRFDYTNFANTALQRQKLMLPKSTRWRRYVPTTA